jgi:hypothetical protein
MMMVAGKDDLGQDFNVIPLDYKARIKPASFGAKLSPCQGTI